MKQKHTHSRRYGCSCFVVLEGGRNQSTNLTDVGWPPIPYYMPALRIEHAAVVASKGFSSALSRPKSIPWLMSDPDPKFTVNYLHPVSILWVNKLCVKKPISWSYLQLIPRLVSRFWLTSQTDWLWGQGHRLRSFLSLSTFWWIRIML